MEFLTRSIKPILSRLPNPFATASTSAGLTTHPTMTAAKDLVENTIQENFVAIFSKSYCPYCTRAKGVIAGLNLGEDKPVKIYELDQREDGSAIQAYLLEKTGQRTVPNIFIKQQHIGGSDDLAKAKGSGALAKLISS